MTTPAARCHVLVAGGGVAGLEALLALHDLAADRVRLTLLAPNPDFVYRPLTVTEPFSAGSATHVPLGDVAADVGATLVAGAVASVDAGARVVTTTSGERLAYDELVLALGSRTEPAVPRAITWSPEADPEIFGGLLRDIDEGYSKRIAFVVPEGAAWPLPAYELALLTAREARAMGHDDVEIALVTAEEAPLAVFGTRASDAVADDLRAAGIVVRDDLPGTGRIVALPRAAGPAVPGVPADDRGFIPIDDHARVRGAERLWAAGDGTDFPVKQGGLATQQADALAEALAAQLGADVEARPFRPVLRGVLLTGDHSRWMRRELGPETPEGETATHTLWWPPTKVAGRYLAPYLAELADAAAVGDADRPDGVPVDLDLDREAVGG